MTRTALAIVFAVFASPLLSQNLVQHGPYYTGLYGGEAMYGNNNRLFLAGGAGGVWYTDDRQSWQKPQTYIRIADNLLKDDSGNLYAYHFGGGVYESNDNGETWIQHDILFWDDSSSEPPFYLSNLVGIGIAGDTIFAAHTQGLGYYKKGSDHGVALPLFSGRPVRALAVDHNMIVVAVDGDGLYVSFNRGDTWNTMPVPWGSSFVEDIIIAGDKLFVNASGVYYSDDWGSNWDRKDDGLGNAADLSWSGSQLYAINNSAYAFSEVDDKWIPLDDPDDVGKSSIAAQGSHVFTVGVSNPVTLHPGYLKESVNAGDTWGDVPLRGYTRDNIEQLAVDSEGNVFASTGNFIFKKKKNESLFEMFARTSGYSGIVIEDDKIYIAGAYTFEVYDTKTGDHIDYNVPVNLDLINNDRLVKAGDQFFVSSQTAGVWRAIKDVGYEEFNAGLGTDIGLFKTSIHAPNWQKIYPTTGEQTVVTVGVNGNTIIISASQNAVSQDNGATWQTLAVRDYFYDIAYKDGKWYATGFGKAWMSTDNGQTWTGRPLEIGFPVFGWTIVPTQDSVYIGTIGTGNMSFKNQKTQAIDFAVTDVTIGKAPFALGASSTEGLPIVYATPHPEKISISATGIATLLKPGKVLVTATQPGTNNIDPAIAVEQSFCINPAKPVITSGGGSGGLVTLTSSSTTGNQWYLNGVTIPTAQSQTLAITAEGDYTVRVFVDDCKSDVSNVTLGITGLEEDYSSLIKVYPNPADDRLMVLTPQDSKIDLVDLYGVTLQQRVSNANQTLEFDVQNLAGGLYLLKVNMNGKMAVKKFVKK